MPNAVHAHLLVNHLAPIATLLALPLLPWKSTFKAACLLLFFAGVGAIAADVTGDEAEPIVEGFHDTNVELIHTHKEAGERSIAGGVIVGVLALVALRTDRRRGLATVALFIAASTSATFLLLAASTGGQIRHPESRPGVDLKQLADPPVPETEDL